MMIMDGSSGRMWFYRTLCGSIPLVSGASTLLGLYAAVIFSLTVLYGKAALGAERDREYDKFLRRTLRARVHGSRCFSGSLAAFAAEALLVLVERAWWYSGRLAVAVGAGAIVLLYYLYRDWTQMLQATEIIYKD